MQIRSNHFLGAEYLLALVVPIKSQARQPEWLKKLAESLPQFTVTASPVSQEGNLPADGKWLATDYELNPDSNSGT